VLIEHFGIRFPRRSLKAREDGTQVARHESVGQPLDVLPCLTLTLSSRDASVPINAQNAVFP
jgi:hypothetical protein